MEVRCKNQFLPVSVIAVSCMFLLSSTITDKMEAIQKVPDISSQQDAIETLELIKKIREEHQLLPIMKAKRPFSMTIDAEKREA